MTPDESFDLYREQIKKVAFSRGEDFVSAEEHIEWAMFTLEKVPTVNKLVDDWLVECIGKESAYDKIERAYRFFEEACELAQACGMTEAEAHKLAKYTWSRPIGEIRQEIGGANSTLHALSNAYGIDTFQAGLAEISRAWIEIDKIRQKHLNKPRRSSLPGQVEAKPWYVFWK